EVPSLDADISVPSVMTLAGLGHRHCVGVLALTDDDHANLSMVMTSKLLRPELPVIARCGDRTVEEHMRDFAADAVVNPHDRYGGYLVLSLLRPHTYQLVTWLMSPLGSPVPEVHEQTASGRWVIAGTGEFADEVARDLTTGGVDVTQVDPADGVPDVTGAEGFIAGTPTDTYNLAMAEHARLQEPDIYLAVRQQHPSTGPLAQALDIDSVFVATDVVARESLARLIAPMFRTFVDHAVTEDDTWARDLCDRIVGTCGAGTPMRDGITIDAAHSPAVARWLTSHELTLGDLLRDPADREDRLAAVALMIARVDGIIYAPSDDEVLHLGDQILLAGSAGAFFDLGSTRHYDAAVHYVVTGERLPQTWVGRLVGQAVGERRSRLQ
ncbi:NAD-binding protein, partial [Kribbia dieselivorans]|uniref:NAD-binding protein n=1 Tax=Kribbia dieselivorans TaxID=331526 RepID=UPI000837ECA0